MSRQLLDESDGFNRCKRCRHGYMTYNINDAHIGRALDLYGDWAKAETDLFAGILRPGAVAIDVGANIGVHTVYLAQAVGPTGRVIAFEPQRLVYQTLCGNIALNSLGNVEAIHAGVGASSGAMHLAELDYSSEHNFGGVSLGAHADGEQVSVVTLDSLDLACVYFIKIDVEGMELDVLRGASSLLEKFRPILYVENASASRSAALIGHLEEAGYHLYWHFSPFFVPDNYFGVSQDVFGGAHDANMLCLPGKVECGLDPVQGIQDTPEQAFRRALGAV